MSITTEVPVPEPLLTENEAAKYLKVSLQWLRKKRPKGEAPPHIEISPRSYRYRTNDLLNWVESRLINHPN